MLCNPKPSLVDRSTLHLSPDKLVLPDIYVDRALLRARVGYDEDGVSGAGPLRGHASQWSDSPGSDVELVAEAKARIQELQREAEILEEAYRTYQQRAVRSTLSHMLPARPLSPQQTKSPLRQTVSHSSHFQSAHKSTFSHKAVCPQTPRIPISESCDPTNIIPHAQPRVTFSEDHNQAKSTVFSECSMQPMAEPLFEIPQDESFAPSRRLSSTPHSSSGRTIQTEIRKGTRTKSLLNS